MANTTVRNEQLKIADGWIDAKESWAYASADSPTFVITVPTDATLKYSVGMRIKLTQTTVKYFIITAVTSTTLTVYGGTDYTLVNAAITNPYYSVQKAPFGFPLDPTKWTVEVLITTDKLQASPADSTWYNVGSSQIVVPIGNWALGYELQMYCAYITTNHVCRYHAGLSTNSSGVSDQQLCTSARHPTGPDILVRTPTRREKNVAIASKTTYYLVAMSNGDNNANSVGVSVDAGNMRLFAICNYL